MMIQKSITQEIQLTTHDGTPMADSRMVAARFGKRHADVLRAIDILQKECPEEFRQRNFALTFREVPGPNGAVRQEPMHLMTRDGFSLLAMGFTGVKAVQWKIRFIDSFNKMERHILQEAKAELRKARQAARHAQLEWQQTRSTGKLARREETDIVKEFIGFAKGQGSKNAEMYYLALSGMINRELFGLEPKNTPKNFRDTLDAAQLGHIQMADIAVARALTEGMAKMLPYKAVFVLARERVRTLVQMVGRPMPVMLGEPANALTLPVQVVA